MGEALSRFPLPKELQVIQSCWQRIAIFIWGSGLKHGDLESAEIKLKITSNLLAKFSRKYLTQKNKWVSTHKSYLEPQIQMPEKTHPSHHSQDFKDAKQRSNTTRCKGKRQLTKKKGRNLKIASDPSSVAWESKEAWDNIFHTLKIINWQLRLMCPAKLSLRTDWGEEGYFKTNTN